MTKSRGFDIILVNDTRACYNGTVMWTLSCDGRCLQSGCIEGKIEADSVCRIGGAGFASKPDSTMLLRLTFRSPEGRILAENRYEGPFCEMKHIAGHPLRMNNELGMRIFR